MPVSSPLFVLTFIIYVIATGLLTIVVGEWRAAIKITVVDAAILPAFVWLVLWLRNFPNRCLQTLTAMAGVGALFTLAVIPPFLLTTGIPGSPLSAPASLLVVVMYVWNVLVLGNILRHALSIVFPAGVLVAIAYVAISTAVTGFVVPEVAS